MKKVLFLTMLTTLLFSCNQGNEKAKEATKTLTATEKNIQEQKALDAHKSVVPTKVMTATVSGMTCEMGCGSTIRKALYLNGGVSKVEYDNFDETKTDNVIKVYFDDHAVSEKDLIAAVGKINDGQYQITKPSVNTIQ